MVCKGYIRYKATFCHKVNHDAQLIIFLFKEKIMFRSQDIFFL